MTITIPKPSLVILVGPSCSGKTTFSKKYFEDDEIISMDLNNQGNKKAKENSIDILYNQISKKLEIGKIVVLDSSNLIESTRKVLLRFANEFHILPIAIVFNISEKECLKRNESKGIVSDCLIKAQMTYLNKTLKTIEKEGFSKVYILNDTKDIDRVKIERVELPNNLKHIHGPFDIIGDIHGCFDELIVLLKKLGYEIDDNNNVYHSDNRKLIFLGDLVDRGPKVVEVLKLVFNVVSSKNGYLVPGNHDMRLLRKLNGHNVQDKHGLKETMEQLKTVDSGFIEKIKTMFTSLPSHYIFDDGNLVVAHAGLKEEFHGKESAAVRAFALYGDTTGTVDEEGFPIRRDWASNYKGNALVVYGHTPIKEPKFINNTINIDTGCVFGGKLTSLRYPEKEVVSTDALEVYSKHTRYICTNEVKAQIV